MPVSMETSRDEERVRYSGGQQVEGCGRISKNQKNTTACSGDKDKEAQLLVG